MMPAQRSNPFLAQAGEHVKFKGSRSSGSVVFSKEGRHRLPTVQSEQACSKKHHLDASCDEVKNEKFINSQPASHPRSSTSVNDLRAELDFRPAAFKRIRQWRIASLNFPNAEFRTSLLIVPRILEDHLTLLVICPSSLQSRETVVKQVHFQRLS